MSILCRFEISSYKMRCIDDFNLSSRCISPMAFSSSATQKSIVDLA